MVELLPNWQPPSTTCTHASHAKSYSFMSEVPVAILNDRISECVLGVDEAGRGPVLGPMVYGVAYCPISFTDGMISEHGFMDSKVLDHTTRVGLMHNICNTDHQLHSTIGWAVRVMSAQDISAGMLKPMAPYNLNAQAHDTTIQLIKDVLSAGVNVRRIYVDTVGIPETYQAKLAREFPMVEVTVAKKADSLYPIVSVASICAKVTRDKALEVAAGSVAGLLKVPSIESVEGLEQIQVEDVQATKDSDNKVRSRKRIKLESETSNSASKGQDQSIWGSGYPSDPRTVAWLKTNKHPIFGWPLAGCGVRYSWSTVKDLLEPPSASAVRTRNAKPDIEPVHVFIDWHDNQDEEEGQMTLSFEPRREGFSVANWFGRNIS